MKPRKPRTLAQWLRGGWGDTRKIYTPSDVGAAWLARIVNERSAFSIDRGQWYIWVLPDGTAITFSEEP